jgi:hypothetical protein
MGAQKLEIGLALMGLPLKNCDRGLVSDGVKTDTKVDIVISINTPGCKQKGVLIEVRINQLGAECVLDVETS